MILMNKNLLPLIFLFLPFVLSAQNKTYKVVCDKNDKKLKVVEAENHSSNLVPVKSGFPFPAIARKWIEDNYATDDCDPDQIVDDIKNENQTQQNQTKTQQQNQTQQNQTQQQQQSQTQSQGATTTNVKKNAGYKNNSFGMDLLFSDLGRHFNLEKNLVIGMGMDLERLFGKQKYIGTGIHFTMLNSTITSIDSDEDPVNLYSFKIPVFAGIRSKMNRTYISFDAGFAYNTKVNELNSGSDFRGMVPKGGSFNFLTRMKIGVEFIQIEIGSDLWLSEIFENQNDNKLSIFYIGYRCNF